MISASAVPSLAALSVVSGVLSALVEALEEFKINFKVRHQCTRREKERFESVMVNKVSKSLAIHNTRARSASF